MINNIFLIFVTNKYFKFLSLWKVSGNIAYTHFQEYTTMIFRL